MTVAMAMAPAPEALVVPADEFDPASEFRGTRPGWVFKTGVQGLGYYLDHCQMDTCEPDDAELANMVLENTPDCQALFRLASIGRFDKLTNILVAFPRLWEARQDNGTTLLHWGVLATQSDFVELAITVGRLSVDTPGADGQTPLMWASILGHIPIMHALLVAKANTRSKDVFGSSPLIHAVQYGQHTALLLLLAVTPEDERKGLLAEVDGRGCSAVHWAAWKGRLESLKLLNHFDADFLHVDRKRNTALHCAMQASSTNVLEFLVDSGVDPMRRNVDDAVCMDLPCDGPDSAASTCLKKLLRARGIDAENLTSSGVTVAPWDVENQPSGSHAVGLRNNGKRDGADAELIRKMRLYKFAMAWLMCVSFAVFEYMLDVRQRCWEIAPLVVVFFEGGVAMSLALFVYVAIVDPGKVPTQPSSRKSAVELLLVALREGSVVPASRLCTSTWLVKGLRTKYCTETRACIQEFDHFCDFTGCAIGRNNHRQFYVLCCVEPATQCWHLLACLLVVWDAKGLPPGVWIVPSWMWHAAVEFPLMVLVGAMHAFTLMFALHLLLMQTFYIVNNLTTNEMINRERYAHLWFDADLSHPDNSARWSRFNNPFCKGTITGNLSDFWWLRARSEVGPRCTKQVRELVNTLKQVGAR